MNQTSGPIRALVACGVKGTATVVAHDSPWLANDIENISDSAEDLGLGCPPDSGLWLWEGSGKLASYATPEGHYEPPEPKYGGSYREVMPVELGELLDLEPPEVCVICGGLAVDVYGDDESMPSCGRAWCELQMQAGLDYQGEVDNR